MRDSVLIEEKSGTVTLTLNRPRKGNCYDGDMASAIAQAMESVSVRTSVTAVVLRGNGKHFCTGADLDWMAQGPTLSREENVREMRKIFRMYEAFLRLRVPLIVLAQGKVRGGGLGLLAVADEVIAEPEADFFLPERSLGLLPGIVEPIIFERIGAEGLRALQDQMIHVSEAKSLGLVTFAGRSCSEQLPKKRTWPMAKLLLQMEQKLLESAARREVFQKRP